MQTETSSMPGLVLVLRPQRYMKHSLILKALTGKHMQRLKD